MKAPPPRVVELLKGFEAAEILLVEWEFSLLYRLGSPMALHGDLFFLTPDNQLPKAYDIAANLGLYPADQVQLPPAYPSEYSDACVRYMFDQPDERRNTPLRRRLVLLPFSWAGITRHDLAPLTHSDTGLPCTVWTVPFPAACASFLRIATHERDNNSVIRMLYLGHVANVIAYQLFDMSYEGAYMELPSDDEPLSDKEVLEMERAVEQIRGWTWRSEEEWMGEALVQVVTGKVPYRDLPCGVK